MGVVQVSEVVGRHHITYEPDARLFLLVSIRYTL